MKAGIAAALLAGAWLTAAPPSSAAPTREDVIWARSTGGAAITLDGVLSEPAWASAESRVVRYGVDNGVPGSGYQEEGGRLATDGTFATLKFLTVGNVLYMSAVVKDSSVGGSKDFNRFDGLLMSVKDHLSLGHPAPPAEYLYSWWYQPDPITGLPVVPDPKAPGLPPTFGGRWSTAPWGSPRTAEQIAAWNAAVHVRGLSNSDAANDTGYVVEMKFDLGVMGYDVTDADGDIIEFNISIYDCDWFWPISAPRFSSNRAWWQSPWGNAQWYSEVRMYAKPSVTVSSGPVPLVGPEVRYPNGAGTPTPVINGSLSDAVWALAPSMDIRYGDDALRDTYGNPLKWRGGQYQPPVNGGEAAVLDPGDATVKWFFKNDILYLGFDVRDGAVGNHPVIDRWDGFIVSIQDKAERGRDRQLKSRRLSFHVGAGGTVIAADYLPFLRDTAMGAQLGLQLKPGTTVDTLGTDFDQGYTAELSVDLTKIGYPAGLGDGALWLGIDLLDGDSFTPFTDSYATRTWWGREYEDECCPAAGYLDPTLLLTTDVGDAIVSGGYRLLGNHPNPFFRTTTLRFALPEPSAVSLEVYDLQGRQVAKRSLGVLSAGLRNASFYDRGELAAGVYLVRLEMADPVSGARKAQVSGKMMLLR